MQLSASAALRGSSGCERTESAAPGPPPTSSPPSQSLTLHLQQLLNVLSYFLLLSLLLIKYLLDFVFPLYIYVALLLRLVTQRP